MELETGVGEHGRGMERKRATYADLEALPDSVVGEIIGGVLHASPRPAGPHSVAGSRLVSALGGPFDWGVGGPGGWVVLYEPELHLGEDVLVPDLAAWRRERMPRPTQHVFYTVAPDWVCEVLSPSTMAVDRKEKLPIYAREGVRNVWLVEPRTRTVEVFRLEAAGYRLLAMHEGSAPIRAEPFEAIELRVAFLWDER